MRKTNAFLSALFLAVGLATLPALSQQLDADVENDYPTEARADYVFGCMQVNGNTRLALQRCSCSIDIIASILPYEQIISRPRRSCLCASGAGRAWPT